MEDDRHDHRFRVCRFRDGPRYVVVRIVFLFPHQRTKQIVKVDYVSPNQRTVDVGVLLDEVSTSHSVPSWVYDSVKSDAQGLIQDSIVIGISRCSLAGFNSLKVESYRVYAV